MNRPLHPVFLSPAVWKRRALCLALLLAASCPAPARAEQTPAELEAALYADGFENVVVTRDPDGRTTHVTFENRRYRWEVVGLGAALGIASAQTEGRLVVVMLNTGVPILRVEVEAADYRAFLRGEMDRNTLFSKMVVTNAAKAPANAGKTSIGNHSSFGKIDLLFSPGVRINLVTPAPIGAFSGAELRLQPGVYTNLWKGLVFDGTYSFPLSSSKPVLSRAAATYNARLGSYTYFQVQGGRLGEDLDGFAANATYMHPSGRHLLGFSLAQASYPAMPRITSYQAFYTWRAASNDVMATISAGRYLAGDTGYTLSMSSGFKERSIDFFYTHTNWSRTLGAGFQIPLGWQRQPYPTAVRMRFRNAFRFIYTDEKPMVGGGEFPMFADAFQTGIRRVNRNQLHLYADDLRDAGKRFLPDAPAEAAK